MPASKGQAEVPAGRKESPDPAPGLGQIADEAYVEAGMADAGFSSVSGARLPSWAGQEGRIRGRWEAAANAVAAHVLANPPTAES